MALHLLVTHLLIHSCWLVQSEPKELYHIQLDLPRIEGEKDRELRLFFNFKHEL